MSFSDRGDDSKGWGMKGRFCIDSLKVQQSESSIIWQLVELISKHNHYKLRLAVTLALTDTGGAVLTLMLGYRNLRKLILAPNPNRYSKCYPDPSDYRTFGLSNLRTIKKPPKGKYVIPWEGNCYRVPVSGCPSCRQPVLKPFHTNPLWNRTRVAHLVIVSKSHLGCLTIGIVSWWNCAITFAHATDTSGSRSSRVNRCRDCNTTAQWTRVQTNQKLVTDKDINLQITEK